MTKQPIDPQTWCFSLRLLMGYPRYAPTAHSIAFAASARKNMIEAPHITSIAEEMDRDIIHVAFEEDVSDGPVEFSLAVRQASCVEWHPSCELYAAGATAPLMILAFDRAFYVGELNLLSKALPPVGKRTKGVGLAMDRLREAASASGPIHLIGNKFVLNGRPWSETMPQEEIQTAA